MLTISGRNTVDYCVAILCTTKLSYKQLIVLGMKCVLIFFAMLSSHKLCPFKRGNFEVEGNMIQMSDVAYGPHVVLPFDILS